jgi:hypothetical protein
MDIRQEMLASIEEYLAKKAKKKENEAELRRRGEIVGKESRVQIRNLSFQGSSSKTPMFRTPLDILLQFMSMTTLQQRGRWMDFLHPALSAPWIAIGRSNTRTMFEYMARWWYDANISFNVAHSPYYQPMLDSIVACGKGFKGTSFHDLGGIFTA